MSYNQNHGKNFEDVFKAAFKGASDYGRSSFSTFDIEADFDKQRGLPTNIKSTKSKLVCLADARTFFSIEIPFRLLVILYVQENTYKRLKYLYEYYISIDDLKKLKGKITYDYVDTLHELLKSYPDGVDGQIKYKNEWRKKKKNILINVAS